MSGKFDLTEFATPTSTDGKAGTFTGLGWLLNEGAQEGVPIMNESQQTGPCFGDLFELDHVCEILRGYAQAFDDDPGLDVTLFNAPKSALGLLVERIEKQEQWHRRKSAVLFPLAAFGRSFVADEYENAKWFAGFVRDHPAELPEKLDGLIVCLHRILLLANLPEDQLAEAKHQATAKALAAVSRRPDQVKKAAFLPWAKALGNNGLSVKNVRELEVLPGFQAEWSGIGDETLKAWAKEAGFRFKAGRPKK